MNETISSLRRWRNFTANVHADYKPEASRHSERRQWTAPSMRVVKLSVLLLGFCVFALGTTAHRLVNLTFGGGVIRRATVVEIRDDANEIDKIVKLQPSRHIWIDAISYAEGIAGWKTSLLELLYLAKALNATLVEPCMTLGRLGSCGDKFNIPVSDLFDLEEYKAPIIGRGFPMLMSYDNYQAALDERDSDIGMVKVCLISDPRLINGTRCSKDALHMKEFGQNDLMHIMEEAKEDNFVLHLEDYWKGSLHELGLRLGMEFPSGKDKEFERMILPFHSKHLQFVDDLLQRSNITSDNFSAIHWRAEKAGLNFTRCARAVNNVKQIILKRNMSSNNITETGEESTHKFVLLSSLNEDSSKMWIGSKNYSNKKSTREALRYLHDNGFVKIDNLLEKEDKLHDTTGMLAIYDLIIASKANNFASCVINGKNDCTEESRRLCEECNHIGKFEGWQHCSEKKRQRWSVGQLNKSKEQKPTQKTARLKDVT